MPPKKHQLGKSLKRSNARIRHLEGTKQMEGIHVDGKAGSKSVTEASDLQELVDNAAAMNKAFLVEKQYNIVYNKKAITTVTEKSNEELEEIRKKYALIVPRRPKWDKEMKPEELDAIEQKTFSEWKRQLYDLQNESKLLLTPYEKNIEFWRQLWRTVEQSDLVLQIVDGRDPLFYYSTDLVNFVNELGGKKSGILINKADLMTDHQREIWLDYFNQRGIRVLFYSALKENKREEANAPKQEVVKHKRRRAKKSPNGNVSSQDEPKTKEKQKEKEKEVIEDEPQEESTQTELYSDKKDTIISDNKYVGSNLLNANELLVEMQRLVEELPLKHNRKRKVVGFCGFPNVGKSSTINSLVGIKKVGVTSTPGKTKHFQTLVLNDDILLCDCPGLVFPSFLSSKEEMICNGVLSIDQMQDCMGPMDLVTRRVNKEILENLYKFTIPTPESFLYDFIDCFESRNPSQAELFLAGFAKSRKFFTNTRGLLDYHRVARIVLKDYCNGKFVYCRPPPGVSDEEFESSRINDSGLID
ncbi:CP-type G domain-containing protein [Entamoeba marina]